MFKAFRKFTSHFSRGNSHDSKGVCVAGKDALCSRVPIKHEIEHYSIRDIIEFTKAYTVGDIDAFIILVSIFEPRTYFNFENVHHCRVAQVYLHNMVQYFDTEIDRIHKIIDSMYQISQRLPETANIFDSEIESYFVSMCAYTNTHIIAIEKYAYVKSKTPDF
jgi:hypothetical protein